LLGERLRTEAPEDVLGAKVRKKSADDRSNTEDVS
jgi:hypothetical protein